MTKLSKLMSGLVTAVLVAVALAKLVLQLGASSQPDPASGRVEPMVFARVISDSPSYLTSGQLWLFGGLCFLLIACFVAWLAVELIERLKAR